MRRRQAIDRFTVEAKRHLHVLGQRLAGRPFIPGKDHPVADIASFLSVGEHLTQRKFLSVHEYSNVLQWAESLVESPAAQRGRAERLNMTCRKMSASGRYVRLATAWSKAPISR